MSKEQRGTKRLCESCEKKFYDLGKTPIICPVCEAPFVEEQPKPKPKPRARPKAAAAPAPAPEEEKEAKTEAVAEDAPSTEGEAPATEGEAPSTEGEAPAPEGEAPATEPASETDPEFVSLEEAAAEEEVDEDAKLADMGDDEVEIPPDENKDAFLENDEDESGSDMSDIVAGAGDSKEET